MGLFDDILKKPQETTPSDTTGQGGSSSGSGGNDPLLTDKPAFLIQKTEESSLFDAPITKTEDVPLESPVMHAEDGGNSVLVNSEETPQKAPENSDEHLAIEETPAMKAFSETMPTENIFSFGQESEKKEEEKKENPLFAESSPILGNTEIQEKKILHPQEFLKNSIADIDSMIAELDTTHDAKIQEAEGYGKEKEHFASLEESAYDEAKDLDAEKSQALHVRELLEKELSTAENATPIAEHLGDIAEDAVKNNVEVAPIEESYFEKESSEVVAGSVETTLTNLAVQNTVTETMEAKTEETIIATEEKKEEPKTEETPIVSLI